MDDAHLKVLRCPKCGKELRSNGDFMEGEIVCTKGHIWSVSKGIPSLVHPPISDEDAKWITEYDEMAEDYDELVKQYDDWLGIDLMKERQNFHMFIPIEGPVKIIDVSIGTGANFIVIHNQFKKQMGRFDLHGMDLSTGMLTVSQRKFVEAGLHVSLTHGSVFNIPYQKNQFDIVLHSGGINTFSDIPGSLNEMFRIASPGGVIVVVDEGLSPKKRETEEGKAIIEANSLFGARPPLQHIPEKAKDVELTYVMNETFYQITFRK